MMAECLKTFNNFAMKTSILLSLISLSFFLIACTNNVTSTEVEEEGNPSIEQTKITLDNVGSTAFVITNIDGDGAAAEKNEENVPIELIIGQRYTFTNSAGASAHPLGFRNADREYLIRQGNNSGTFGDDADVNVVKSGDDISFTLTEALAEEIVQYICVFHPGMSSEITVIE